MSLKMLPKFWRPRMINLTGQTITWDDSARIVARITPWKLVSGNRTDGTTIVENFGFVSGQAVLNEGEVEGAVVDNSSDLYFGAYGTFTVTPDKDDSVGSCKLYLEFSDNDGNWPSDSDDFVITDLIPVITLPIDNSNIVKSRAVNFEI